MCGIFGYVNSNFPKSRQGVVNLLLGGLSCLEYRGYDSAGKNPGRQELIAINHHHVNTQILMFRYRL